MAEFHLTEQLACNNLSKACSYLKDERGEKTSVYLQNPRLFGDLFFSGLFATNLQLFPSLLQDMRCVTEADLSKFSTDNSENMNPANGYSSLSCCTSSHKIVSEVMSLFGSIL